MPHVILFVSSTHGITFKVVVCFDAYTTICMKKLADFYIGLYCQPGNLGQRSAGYSFHAFLVHFTSYEHYPCMHALRYMHAVDGDPIMLS